MSSRVPFIRPAFPAPALVATDFEEIVASNWFTNFGPKEREFASELAGRIGPEFTAITYSNATIGLMAALHCGMGRGDGSTSILVPSFTFAAGPAAIEWAGYRPLFVDIEEDSLQPSVLSARAAIAHGGHAIAGILLCNSFGIGNPAISEWESLAAEADLPLVVDSAAGFGSRYDGVRMVGAAGVAEVFSFHATKPLAVGEGGAVVTRDPALADALKRFENFGFDDTRSAAALGLNGKLQEINAAIGLRQLADLDRAIDTRRAVVMRYRSALTPYGIRFPANISASSVCFASAVMPTTVIRDRALAVLTERGVEARTYYSPAVHRQTHFEACSRADALPVTVDMGRRILSLPVHQDMADDDLAAVIGAVADAVG